MAYWSDGLRLVKGTDMWNQLKLSYVLVGLIIILTGGNALATGYKTTELNRKMAEISSLQQDLSDKLAMAVDKKKLLNLKTEALKDEIRQEKDHLKIDSYQMQF